jgi:amino acid adenylation domain-containing protein
VAVYEFPTSFGQRRMWLLAEMDPGEPTYNTAWALWLDGPLDVSALRQAWDAALIRHETLRTTFRNDSGVPVQVIEDEPAAQPLLVTSVEQLPADEREQAAADHIRRLARIPFDLVVGPLARAALVRLSPQAHVLVVVIHQIVADGWSFRVLFDELSADYEAIAGGGDPMTAEPPIQYADFAIWQVEHAEDSGYAAARRFWRAELAGAPSTLPLPTDEPYPARQTFTARCIDTRIDASLAEALEDVAAQHGTTLFTVLLTAYAVVLARLSGRDDLLIAVPTAARTRPETQSVVGLFSDTVPIRVRIEDTRSLSDLVRSVHDATTRALAHQELPSAQVVEAAQPDRDPARLPLVQVMFAREEPWGVPDRGGLRWRPEPMANGTAGFEIELTVTGAPEGPRLRVTYNSDLFAPATGQLVADGYLAILRRLREDPGSAVADADIMSPGTRALVTSGWPDGGPVADPAATAVAMLWQACAGDAVVATGADGALTGAGVRALAQRVTAAVQGHGVGVADRVAIMLPRGARLLPAILGVWSAGASYVPLDPIYPAQRLATMLEDSGAAAIVVDSSRTDVPALPSAVAAIPVIDLAALPAGSAEPVDLPPLATAVTIFTSGSTGRPKAVSVPQGAIGAFLAAMAPILALGPDDRLVAVTTFSFDIALLELLAPVLAGGCVVVADAEQARDAARLRELLTDSGATALQMTPAGWRMLIDAGGIPAGVRLRVCGGEALPRDLADAIGAGAGVRLLNLYGPTETTIWSGGDTVERGPAPIEIGSVVAGTQLYVLDAGLRPVPPGVFGEVYIGGAGVAHGYHGAPGLTAARFVPDPFGGRPGARMYRTGDIGRWRRTGKIELAGRADRQIKIRGYRIESGEVEAVLRDHDEVAQAVVAVHGGGHDVRLVGYLVTASGAETPPSGLREHLREVLPEYMVPAAFVVLPALPLTANGKIDYRALPEPDWGAASGQVPVAPRTPTESRLAEMVAELLALPAPIGVYDNFFALGGHSLTVARLMARIQAVYGVDLPIYTMFSDPTVAGLAAAVAGAGGDGADAAAAPQGPHRPDPGGAQAGDMLRPLLPGDRR